jgi:uncharacterized LabA/DUF88 family protein
VTTEDTNFKHSDAEEAVAEYQPAPETTPTSTGEQTGEATSPTHTAVNANEQQITGESIGFSFAGAIPLIEESIARSFTDYIEEFRQAEEAHFSSSQPESTAEPDSSPIDVIDAGAAEIVSPWEIAPVTNEPRGGESSKKTRDTIESPVSQGEQQTSSIEQEMVSEPASTAVNVPGEQNPPEPVPAPPETRPVSPLLRPASRPRMPRHASARQREEQAAAETKETRQAISTPAPEEPPAQEQPRPARRYRFDRPAAQAAPTPIPGQSRSEEGKEAAARSLATPSSPAHKNGGSSAGEGTKEANGQSKKSSHTVQSQGSSKQPVTLESPAANGTGAGTEAPVVADHDKNRRHGQDRQREKEQAAPAPAASPVAEGAVITPEPNTTQITEVSVEDLPPLEYSELQRASSRRRRRRRSGDTASPAQAPMPPTTGLTTRPETPTTPATPTTPTTPAQPSTTAVSRSVAQTPGAVPAAGQYNIVSGYTVGQMNQGNDVTGPFMSPEPSPARGSMPARGNLRAIRPESQRTSVYPVRTGDVALNQFANSVVQAIQAQTDRMVSELRRVSQTPANISVSLPSLPSTERVGVFVDVANLLYSARTLRINIDFGKLLDFLRGNRRLVRAQAYCPTSPQSGEEQMFLQAVKGLGYRITTKNYKTFSSGAKKADLDLDLCMDVVRLVDGRAVDSIVLVSGDSDFMPMLDYCSDHGVRVEVAAFDEAMSATLRQSCDLFINLAMLEDIRA